MYAPPPPPPPGGAGWPPPAYARVAIPGGGGGGGGGGGAIHSSAIDVGVDDVDKGKGVGGVVHQQAVPAVPPPDDSGAHSVLYLCGLDALGWSLGIRHTLAVGLYLVRGFWPGVAVAAALLGGGIAARRTLIRRYGPVVAYGCVTDLPPPPAEGDDADDGGASGAGRHADLVARALTAYLPPPLRPLPPLPEALVAAAAGK